jgi:hypothetical protein
LALALCVCLPAATALAAPTAAAPPAVSTATATQAASIEAGFAPERLGAATTVSLGFQIAPGEAPSGLAAMQLAYPRDLGLATSGLGVAPCQPAALEDFGIHACPADSKMGSGTAEVEIPLGPSVVTESVALTLFAGASPDGYLHVLVYAVGARPVEAQVVLSGVLLPGRLSVTVPPIPSLPQAPDVILTRMRLTLGGRLTYYERVHGRSVAYHPPGVGLPDSCPRGGFPFAATFAFIDGSRALASTAVPCPRHH